MASKYTILYIDTGKSVKNSLITATNNTRPATMKPMVYGDTLLFDIRFIYTGSYDKQIAATGNSLRVGVGNPKTGLKYAQNDTWGLVENQGWTGSLSLATNNLSGSIIGKDFLDAVFEVETFNNNDNSRTTYCQVPIVVYNQVLSSSIAPISASEYFNKTESDARYALSSVIGAGWISGSGITTTPNKVGIGTTSPSADLHVYSTAGENVLVETDDAVESSVHFVNTAGDGAVGINASGRLALGPNLDTAAAITILSSSVPTVGIGTTPTQYAGVNTYLTQSNNTNEVAGVKTEVYCDSSAQRTAMTLGHYATVYATGSSWWSSSPFGIGGGYFAAYHKGSGNVTGLAGLVSVAGIPSTCTATPTVTSSYGLYISMQNAKASSTIQTASAVFIQTFTATGTITNRYGIFQVGGSEKNYFAGYLGCGTTSASVQLDVAGNSHMSGYLKIGALAGTTYAANIWGRAWTTGSDAGVSLADRTAGNTTTYTLYSTAGIFRVYSAGADRFYIDSAGAVTASKIEVSSNLQIANAAPYMGFFKPGGRMGWLGYAQSTDPTTTFLTADSGSVGTVGNNGIILRLGGTNMLVVSGSSVGINQATPQNYADKFFVYSTQMAPVAPIAYTFHYATPTGSTTCDYIGQKVASVILGSYHATGVIYGLHAQGGWQSSGNATSVYGAGIWGKNSSTGKATSVYGVYIKNQNENASGVITSSYGLYIDETQRTGIVQNSYGVYQTGSTETNLFNGYTNVGTTSSIAKFNVSASSGLSGYFNGTVAVATSSMTGGNLVVGASNASKASLVLHPGTTPTSPEAGSLWTDTSTPNAVSVYRYGMTHALAGVIGRNTATVTRNAATTTEQALTSPTITLAANFLTQYKLVKVKAWGFHTAVTPPTHSVQVRLKLGTEVICDMGSIIMSTTTTNGPWSFEGLISVRTTGASGTVVGDAIMSYYSGTAEASVASTSTGAVTVDTTGTLVLGLTVDFLDGDSSDQWVCQQLYVEAM